MVERLLTPTGTFIPNSVGNTGWLFAGLARLARAGLLGRVSRTSVRFVKSMVNLEALRALLASNDVKVLTGQVYSLDEAGKAVGHMLGHHAKGRGVIAV